MQTEEPYWLAEAYQNPIARADYGLLARNIVFAQLTFKVIVNLFDPQAQFLDYGSGYGTLVQLMWYLGLDFYGHDRYCEHKFALDRKREELSGETYELVTAFEVIEHLPNPVEDLHAISQLTDSILLSTELLPDSNPEPQAWPYYALEEGQHIGIHTPESMRILAEALQLNLYTNNASIHLLTKRNFSPDLPRILDFNHYGIFPKFQELLLKDVPTGLDCSVSELSTSSRQSSAKIVIDCVFFQRYQTGIARLWRSILALWSVELEWADQIIIVDRAGTAPKFPNFKYRTIPPHDYNDLERDRQILQTVCDEENAAIFISTYYTIPIVTPSVFMAYDMIPEALGSDTTNPIWQEKHRAIQYASNFISISNNTAQDLANYFPNINAEAITVAYCGVDSIFHPATRQDVESFKQKYAIQKPFFLVSSATTGYKNVQLFFKAFSQLPTRFGFEILCTGNPGAIDQTLRNFVPGTVIHALHLDDVELSQAFSGAIALVYPSIYEGFGLPVLEAMACGCPVITCPNASIPEVGGDAVLYVDASDLSGMMDALCEIQKPTVRKQLIERGLQRAKQFSWSQMAAQVLEVLVNTTLADLNLQELNFIAFPDWSQPETVLAAQLQTLIQTVSGSAGDRPITLLLANRQLESEVANLLLTGILMEALVVRANYKHRLHSG
ncbi:MAG: glycosyltransferase [Spirulinaceae cyanobacterium RM2_2_10]|nr:glycosyltransferase [Spirulinaceae cyanobacterium RM2_2_10]